MNTPEECCVCGDKTGKAGEDSLYTEDGLGPYCDRCHGAEIKLARVQAELAIAKAFCNVAVAERNYERVKCDRIEEERNAAQQRIVNLELQVNSLEEELTRQKREYDS